MDTVTKTGIYTAKTASKRVVKKTAEATGDLVGDKIADKITYQAKQKVKKKKMKDKKSTYRQKKDHKLLMIEIEIVLTPYENGIPKDYKLVRYNI